MKPAYLVLAVVAAVTVTACKPEPAPQKIDVAAPPVEQKATEHKRQKGERYEPVYNGKTF